MFLYARIEGDNEEEFIYDQYIKLDGWFEDGGS